MWAGLAGLTLAAFAAARDLIHVTHAYANSNAQSLIGVPMGGHKTIVDMQGNLHWSQWSLKTRGLDVPFAFSAQMDGELAIQVYSGGPQIKVTRQHLYHNRFPFVVTRLAGDSLSVEELAFSTQPPGNGLDVVHLRLRNSGMEVAEETELPADAPAGAEGIRRQLPWSCRAEPNPPLSP